MMAARIQEDNYLWEGRMNRVKKNKTLFLFCGALLLGFASTQLWAQVLSGAISGSVTDSTGAVISSNTR